MGAPQAKKVLIDRKKSRFTVTRDLEEAPVKRPSPWAWLGLFRLGSNNRHHMTRAGE